MRYQHSHETGGCIHRPVVYETPMYLFLIPLLLGFALVGASTFTAAYCHRWGERRSELATSILRNYLGIQGPCAICGIVYRETGA